MKTTKLISKMLGAALFTGALLLGSSAAFAQNQGVKIGTNATTKDPNANVEVEPSTTGRIFRLHSTTGQMTHKDGTEGVGKVLTSDASGNASWQTVADQSAEVMISVNGSQSISTAFGVNVKFNFTAKRYDKNSNFNLSTDIFTAPSSGFYLFTVSDQVGNHATDPYVAWGRLNNTDGSGLLEAGDYNLALDPGVTGKGSVTTLAKLNAGQQVILEVSSNPNNTARTRSIVWQIAKLSN